MPKVAKLRAADIPPMDLTKGMHTRYLVCRETVGSEALRMGVCNHEPDMADLKWEGKSEESFYVAKGSIRLIWEGDGGERGDVVVREGESIYLPKGFRYILRATGEPAINVFGIGGTSTSLEPIVGPERAKQIKDAADRAVRM
jgi:mannose-6-phosphate isomerase-like protein (cupin superfamily)